MELRLPDSPEKYDLLDQQSLRRQIEAFARQPLNTVAEGPTSLTVYVSELRRDVDTSRLTLEGGRSGSVANGALFELAGNDFTAGSRGHFQLVAGNPGTPTGADGTIRFYTGDAVERWRVNRLGHIEPQTATTYSVGAAALPLLSVFASLYRDGNGDQVLTARKTGWGNPTTTVNRSAITDATTLAVAVQILGTLIADLRNTHGMLGA